MVMEILAHDTNQDNINEGTEEDNSFVAIKESKPETKHGNGHELVRPNVANGEAKEGDRSVDANFPRDAVEEWPAEKKIHNFYLVRYRTFEDPKLKSRIDNADKEVTKCTQNRVQITDALKAKRSERSNVILQLKPLTAEDRQYRMIMDEKRKSMEPLQDALGKLRNANIAVRERGMGLCSSEEELNDLIYSLNYHMQHESLSLVEEKQLIKEIKMLEGTRDKVISNASEKAKIQDSFGHKEAIQDQVKLINDDIGGVKKEKQAIRMKIKSLEDELKIIDDDISSLQEELENINKKRNKAFETLVELRKSRDEANSCFFQNRAVLNRAKDLAAKKDMTSLPDFVYTEVEKFMSDWSNGERAFREDYEKRILSSLDSRQLSRDGRMRNPDEKPIIPVEGPATRDLEAAPVKLATPAKLNAKQTEDVHLPQQDVIPNKKTQETNVKKSSKVVESRAKAEDPTSIADSPAIEKPQETPKPNEIDAVKLKEVKREEEIAKAKLAFERKKKQAEKAAAKAVVRAQKEFEKKLKEKEKRLRKKAGGSTPDAPTEEPEVESKVSEPEEVTVDTDTPVAENSKGRKDNARFRNRPTGRGQVPKIMLKRKKTPSYWIWAAPAAVAAVLLAAAAFYYLAST
ncbi:proton pump-interactor 1-like [Zingiber officinale]|uniref:proton pump-interactor 1-like n=1 Tax=Zingiber officinale TaxID=94328 RepID=UPI001C4C1380|nr:proton pump-interactor 1-like [Zingiber officinale]